MYTGILVPGYQAGGALTKHRFVKISGNQTVVQTAASTDRSLGVVNVDVSAGEATLGKSFDVHVHGVPWVEAGAAVTQGGRVMSDSSGRAINAATATNIPTGVALKAAANAGDLIPVLLTPGMPPL